MKVLIVDPAASYRDGWHDIYGSASDALNGNISRVFLTGVSDSVPTTKCRQPDGWSCGPYALAECTGQSSGEQAREWLKVRGYITSQYGTEYAGIVEYLKSCGYTCSYDGENHDGEINGTFYNDLISHLKGGHKAILCMHHDRTNYWTNSGHYIVAYGIDEKGIVIEGLWGPATTKALQHIFKTEEDGIISNQNKIMKPYLPNCQTESWKFVTKKNMKTGSALIRAIQKYLGIEPDGFCGMETIKAIQKWLGVDIDGYIGGRTVTALQKWINTQS